MNIPFNIPYLSGKENNYIKDAIHYSGKKGFISYTDRCKTLLNDKLGYNEIYLTTSCTSALEISAILINIENGDEVIIPSYTYPSTANAFIRQGAKVICADSRTDNPGIDEYKIESLITEKTKAIVPVHYAGVACDMHKIMMIANKHNLFVIEDAAHALDAYFNNYSLGSLGHIGCLSFHRTKNIQCGEGGAIIINDKKFSKRVINILEKGTNRQELISGRTDNYEWVDIGSSYTMSELHAAYLYSQLEVSDLIKEKRKSIWQTYYSLLLPLQEKGLVKLPVIPSSADHNAHIFYLVLNGSEIMYGLKNFLTDHHIQATSHYTPLIISDYWKKHGMPPTENLNSLMYFKNLLRLPLYNAMSTDLVKTVVEAISEFFSLKV